MKKGTRTFISLVVLGIVVVASGFAINTSTVQKEQIASSKENKEEQLINIFVTHGHCSTPFRGVVDNLEVSLPQSNYFGSRSEVMKLSFEMAPNLFNSSLERVTERVQTPDLFIGSNNEKIVFRSTNVYTMGEDWYHINCKMSIKGIEKNVKFFATGIKNPKETKTSTLVLEGQLNLLDWGIDYDKIVMGESAIVPTQWMHLNMKIDLAEVNNSTFSSTNYFN
jgi:polyisoprenoid-binding protein YceI